MHRPLARCQYQTARPHSLGTSCSLPRATPRHTHFDIALRTAIGQGRVVLGRIGYDLARAAAAGVGNLASLARWEVFTATCVRTDVLEGPARDVRCGAGVPRRGQVLPACPRCAVRSRSSSSWTSFA